jgi:uncharacterized lipoprotein
MIRDRSGEYSAAEEGVPLKVPEPYSSAGMRPLYPIPEAASRGVLRQNYQLPAPPDATAVVDDAPFRIETESEEGATWLHLFTAPGRVWPVLDDFWRSKGMRVRQEQIASGFVVIEVGDALAADAVEHWPETLRQQLPGMQVQALVRQGVRRNTTELQVRVLATDVAAQEWHAQSMQPAVERDLLEVIGRYLSSDTGQNRYSLLANDIGGESRVRLLRDEVDQHFLVLQLSYARAWTEVGDALTAAGVVVADLDRSERVYFVSVLDEDELSSWYEPFANEDQLRKQHNFALRFTLADDGTVVVRAEALNPDVPPERAEELLQLVFEHIS